MLFRYGQNQQHKPKRFLYTDTSKYVEFLFIVFEIIAPYRS